MTTIQESISDSTNERTLSAKATGTRLPGGGNAHGAGFCSKNRRIVNLKRESPTHSTHQTEQIGREFLIFSKGTIPGSTSVARVVEWECSDRSVRGGARQASGFRFYTQGSSGPSDTSQTS